MSNKTIINGWSINHGDYEVDHDYNELYKQAERKKKIVKNTLLFTGSLCLTLSAIITIYLTN